MTDLTEGFQTEETNEIEQDLENRKQSVRERINMGVDRLATCRQIVSEILKFGVGQKEILHIISLLSLEIENHEVSTDLSIIAKDYLATLPKEDWETQRSLIIPE